MENIWFTRKLLELSCSMILTLTCTKATPRYVQGAFQYTTQEEAKGFSMHSNLSTSKLTTILSVIYDRIPSNTEILLTHTPPYQTLDKSRRGTLAGCRQLAMKVDSLKSCRLHVFGHIHEAHGVLVQPDGQVGDDSETSTHGRVSVNAAIAHYPVSQAVVIDLRN